MKKCEGGRHICEGYFRRKLIESFETSMPIKGEILNLILRERYIYIYKLNSFVFLCVYIENF